MTTLTEKCIDEMQWLIENLAAEMNKLRANPQEFNKALCKLEKLKSAMAKAEARAAASEVQQ